MSWNVKCHQMSNVMEMPMLMLDIWPQAETAGVTHFGAYHRPPDGHFWPCPPHPLRYCCYCCPPPPSRPPPPCCCCSPYPPPCRPCPPPCLPFPPPPRCPPPPSWWWCRPPLLWCRPPWWREAAAGIGYSRSWIHCSYWFIGNLPFVVCIAYML